MNKHASTLRAANAIHEKELARIFGTGCVEAIAWEIDRLCAFEMAASCQTGIPVENYGNTAHNPDWQCLDCAHPGHCAECG